MKPLAIVLTALVLSVAGTGAVLAHPIYRAVLNPAEAAPNTAQCPATPRGDMPWTKADVAHLLSYMQIPYDSISSAPGDCMTVAIRGHDGALDRDILNPATLTQVL